MAKKLLYIITIMAVAFMVSGWKPFVEYRTEKHIHTVVAGQTIWEIAADHQSKQDKKMSVGELVHKIYKANGIDPKLYIQPGDKLIIPLEMEVK